MRDRLGVGDYYRFGSTHFGSSHYVFCDGSIHTIAYTIEPEIHRRLGNRRDHKPVDASKF